MDLAELLLVGGQAQAAVATDGVAAERLHGRERRLGPLPELSRAVRTVRVPGDVVPRRAAAQEEAAVAAARALGDPARVAHTNP